jgi:hypothetical protein
MVVVTGRDCAQSGLRQSSRACGPIPEQTAAADSSRSLCWQRIVDRFQASVGLVSTPLRNKTACRVFLPEKTDFESVGKELLVAIKAVGRTGRLTHVTGMHRGANE